MPSSGSDPKPEPASSGPGMTSVSAPVTSAAPPEEEEEESEDESEILEESPCGRWQKRREEVSAGSRSWAAGEPGRGPPPPCPASPRLPPPSPVPLPPVPGQLGPRAGIEGWPLGNRGAAVPRARSVSAGCSSAVFPCRRLR